MPYNVLLLLQEAEEHITFGRAALEFIGFLSFFGVYGALGFHFQVLRSLRGDNGSLRDPVQRADQRAAVIGITGALLMVVNLVIGASARAAQKNVSMMEALSAGGGRQVFQIACIVLLVISFLLASVRLRAGWIVAGLTGLAYALRAITSGRWFSLVNPLHEVAASLWLGTLMVLLFAGLSTAFSGGVKGEQRGRFVAEMVSRFSPLALSAAVLLGITGVTTAWRHLKHVNSLWTTPYGYALDVKLCVVAIVVALGAWNWRRVAPRLGDEESAVTIRRSATTELSFAAIVLVLTSVLVSLPSPGPTRRPGVLGVPRTGAPRDSSSTRHETRKPAT
jgi:putative copper export protein